MAICALGDTLGGRSASNCRHLSVVPSHARPIPRLVLPQARRFQLAVEPAAAGSSRRRSIAARIGLIRIVADIGPLDGAEMTTISNTAGAASVPEALCDVKESKPPKPLSKGNRWSILSVLFAQRFTTGRKAMGR